MSILLIGLVLAGAFFALHTILRRRGDEALYKHVTLIPIATALVSVAAIIAAIELGFVTDHVP